jgi:choline-sulfatase
MKDKKPNILFIMTDQQRWDSLGSVGGWVKTPSLDAIAEDGFLFSNCYTNSPVCAPARLALASGLYPHNHGVWSNVAYDLPSSMFTWMKAVRSAGYRTSLFGKAHLRARHDDDIRNLEHFMHCYGFDDVNEIVGPRASTKTLSHMTARWHEEGYLHAYVNDYKDRFSSKPHVARPSPLPLELYADCYIAAEARTYLQAYDDEKPWCSMLSFGGPHEPWDAPVPYADMYDPEFMPKARQLNSDWRTLKRSTLKEKFSKPWNLKGNDTQELRANYAGNVTLIDDQIGEVVELLKLKGEYDNTWIVFTSDHGELNGDYGLIYKNCFFDGASRVPLIIKPPKNWERIGQQHSHDVMVEMFDVGATLVELVGAKPPVNYFARSLLPYMRGDVAQHRPFAISEFKKELMYVDKDWKMAVNNEGQPYLLFDRRADPEESVNLAGGDRQDIEVELIGKLFRRLLASQSTKPLVNVDKHLWPD